MQDSKNSFDTSDAHASRPIRHSTIRVTTGARLHFGLLDVAPPFGGCGVMIDGPGTTIVAEPSDHFTCEPSLQERLEPIARRLAESIGNPQLPCCRLRVVSRAPAHRGLGSGTQLAMAAADAMCRFVGATFDSIDDAQRIAARGERSAVGMHGFFHGGLIFESPRDDASINPIRQQVALPDDWRVALICPRTEPACAAGLVSGAKEREQFSRLAAADRQTREQLESLCEKGVIAAARDADFGKFTAALTEYNRRSGMLFRSVQGGAYNGPAVTRLVQALVDRGATGVGQSSWGPSVFSWFDSASEAQRFCQDLPDEAALTCVSRPLNRGRTVQVDDVN